MSADLLREAADAIRADNQPWHGPRECCDDTFCVEARFMWAVADWLDAAARDEEADAITAGRGDGYPLAVARAYLGESA